MLEKVDFLAYLQDEDTTKIKSPRGWLRKAIEEDYSPPDGYKSAAQRAAEAATERARLAEQSDGNDQVVQRIQAAEQQKAEAKAQQREAEAACLEQLYAQYGTTTEERAIWPHVLAELEMKLSATAFQEHIASSILFKVHEGQAMIGLKQYAARDWVMNRLSDKIQRTLSKHLNLNSLVLSFVSFQPL